MTAIKQIESQIRRFVRKYYLNELFKGAALFVLFSLLYLFVSALVEYFFWLPANRRVFLYYGQWLVLGLFFLIFLAKPLLNLIGIRKDLPDEKAAEIIGKFFPDIKDKLLNTLQLYRSGQTSELVLAGVEQKAERLQHFKFSKAVNFKHNYKYLSLLFIPLLISLVLRLTHFDRQIKKSYERILSYNENFTPPLPYRFYILDSLQVVAGKDYDLHLKVSGNTLPDQLFINFDEHKFVLQKQNDSIFSFHFPVVNQDMTFNLTDNKYRLGQYHLSVIKPPVIQSAKVKLVYPAYLHKAPKILRQIGNLTVPQSTHIYWSFNTNHTDSLAFAINDKYKHLPVHNSFVKTDHIAQNSFSYRVKPYNKQLRNYAQFDYQVNVIKDEFPKVVVAQKKDTLNNLVLHRITGSDDHAVTKLKLVYTNEQTHQVKQLNIPVKKSDFIQAFYVFPKNLNLQSGVTYAYYFKIYDNDSYHGYKSAKSKTFYYNKLTDKQLEKKLLEEQSKNIQDFAQLKQKSSKQKQMLQNLTQKLSSQKNTDWQTKKQLQNTIQQSEQQEQFFKQTIQKFKNILKKLPKDKQSETKKDLEKRLEELAAMKKKQKLLDELKKLAEKLKKEDLVKKLKDLENYSEHQEKSLERILELTKKYYMQQKMQKIADKLSKLAQKQDSLAKKNNDTAKAQDSLNKALDKLQKQTDSLNKMNQSLKKPMPIPDTKTDMEDIKQDMQKAKQDLQQEQSSKANQSQKKAANKMKKLSKAMQMSMMSGGGEQQEEDIKTLQAILKSLLHFSFKEEGFITDIYTHNARKYLSKQLISQHNLKTYFKHINDSLYTLALRNPKISQFILDESFEIKNSLDKSLEHLSENQLYKTQSDAQYILKSSNRLANLLSNSLDNMKNGSPSMGQGQGKKGKGFSLPDIIKKQNQAISKAKEGLKKGGKKQGDKSGKEKGKSGKGDKGKGDKGKGEQQKPGNEGEAKRQYELYKMQQQVKEDLNQLGDKFSDQATKKRIKDLAKKMDELQHKILKEGITEQTVQKMIALQHELLKLKNASFNQHEDDKRESRSNFRQFNGLDSLFFRENFKFLPENELLNRNQLPVNQKVKQKIIKYLN